MKIGIDLDEVLAEFVSAFLQFHNEKYGTKLNKNHFHVYEFEKVLGGTEENAADKAYEFFGTHHFKNIQPTEGARKAMEKLAKAGHELFVITSRQSEVVEDTKNWLEANFPKVFKEIHFTSNKYGRTNPNISKTDACKKIGISLLIEDNLEHASSCAAEGINVLLLDRPWNQGELPKNVKRFSLWEEVLKEIERIGEK